MSDLDQFDINNTLQCACSPFVYLFFFYYYLFNFRSTRKRNLLYTTGATCGAWIVYPSGAPELDSCYSIFSFMCMFCRSLFVLLYFSFWPFCCLFFDLRILTTPLVSSNSSYSKALLFKTRGGYETKMTVIKLWFIVR
jgi:hypothetical protein